MRTPENRPESVLQLPTTERSSPIVEADELLNWDFQLEVDASGRASGTIEVEVADVGRALPLPLADPQDEA